jgi:hypothetical protein
VTDIDATVNQALAFAGRGWPVFPCRSGVKVPLTRHGYREATTDRDQIIQWFTDYPNSNLAVATGAPGPDVLDVDQHGPAGDGYAAFGKLCAAGLASRAAAWVRTPSGGMHAYFAGSGQRSGRLPGHHLDFRSQGGYVLTPPSQIGGRSYQVTLISDHREGLDWAAVIRLLEPQHQLGHPGQRPAPDLDLSHLARWVAAQPQGNRNSGLYWAANRALDADSAADLSPLAVAARQAGLTEPEITRTLDSARKTSQAQRQAGTEE